MDAHLGVLVVLCFVWSSICSANVINYNELVILSSELSDQECKKLLSVLYERRRSSTTVSPLDSRYSGRCVPDLIRWLGGEGKGSLPLTELNEALSEIEKPALGRQIEEEVFAEKTHNLRNLFGEDGHLVSKDIFAKRGR